MNTNEIVFLALMCCYFLKKSLFSISRCFSDSIIFLAMIRIIKCCNFFRVVLHLWFLFHLIISLQVLVFNLFQTQLPLFLSEKNSLHQKFFLVNVWMLLSFPSKLNTLFYHWIILLWWMFLSFLSEVIWARCHWLRIKQSKLTTCEFRYDCQSFTRYSPRSIRIRSLYFSFCICRFFFVVV